MPYLYESSAALVALTALVTAIGYLGRKARKAGLVLEAINRVVQRELTPNHGGSIKDDATGTAITVGQLSRSVDTLTATVSEVVDRVEDLERSRARHHPERPTT